jgi:hypothetical protein
MPYERTGYAPWSLTREAGVESATVDGTIQVPQYVYPNLDTGFIDEKGVWQGRKSNDRSFIGITKAEGIANGGEVLFPDTNEFPAIDMTGFVHLQIAFKPSNGGNFAMEAVMGPDTESYANLSPVNPASALQGAYVYPGAANDFETLFSDSAQSLTADVWNIFMIKGILFDQKLLQFKTTNNTGGASDIEFAFMRLV